MGLPPTRMLQWFLLPNLENFIVTQNFSATYRDWQKTRHRDAVGT
jgi:hypothetical protein